MMINGQGGKYRIGDVIREADVYRMTKSTRQARKAKRRTRIPLVGALAVLMASASPAAAAPGDLDPSFDGDGKVSTDFAGGFDSARGMAIQGDGKIVAAGSTDVAGTGDFALARYNPDGSLDPTFDGDGLVSTDFGSADQAFSVAIQGDGKIVAAGSTGGGTGHAFALARYNIDGSVDPTFDGDGTVITDFANGADQAFSVAIQGNGKIVAAGLASVAGNQDFGLARYNTDGSLDATFDGDGLVITDFAGGADQAFGMAIQGDGKIVAAGSAGVGGNQDFGLARYNTDGSPDSTFGGVGTVTRDFAGGADQARGVALQGDGKIVAAGSADVSGGASIFDFALARYNPDGFLDDTFHGDGTVSTDFAGGVDQALEVAIQGDGKIVAAGSAAVAGNDDFGLARYDPEGFLDPTFNGDGLVSTDFAGGSDQARAVAIQGDGKIVAAGSTGVAGTGDFAVARYTVCRRTSRPSSIPFCA